MAKRIEELTSVLPHELTTRVVTDTASWEALRPHWDNLLNASHDSTPWQNWDYLSHWWRNLGKDKRLRIVVVEQGGVPLMIFPLQLGRENMIGLSTRILEPISMLWDVNRPRFAIGRHDDAVYRRGLEAIWGFRKEWDTLRVEELPLEDAQARGLEAFAAEHGLRFRHAQSSVVPFIRIDCSWQDFLKTRGSKMKKNLRASLRRLEASGPVVLSSYETPAEVAEAFKITMDLHRKSWKRKKKVGLSLSDQYRSFFESFLMAMAQRGQARVLVLRTGERPVASTIAFMHLDTYFSTEIVHDAEFAACSPGTLLESLELERVMNERRYANYDFLGRFLSNKQRWTEHARITHRIYVFRPTLKNWLLDLHYFRAKPMVKRVWRTLFGLSKSTAQAMRFIKKS
jgi:CelD/BcsL family acetyltransferase involved in cellulose biosynthesis